MASSAVKGLNKFYSCYMASIVTIFNEVTLHW